MCQRLPQLTAAMREYSTQFDASLLSAADAADVVQQAAAVEHMASAVKSLAAARAAQAQSWKASGHRSAEEQLAHCTGTTVAGAREALALGRRLDRQPEVAAAALSGTLSPTQASAIADAVDAAPTAAGGLLEAATAGVLEWLHPTCAATGCACTARLEVDHRVDWADIHITLVDWLDALCHHHNQLKTGHGWALVNGVGKRAFVGPTNPRNPRHNPPTAA